MAIEPRLSCSKMMDNIVPEIRRATNHHDINIRKWIHRFNEKGLDGIVSKIHKYKPIKITNDIEKR